MDNWLRNNNIIRIVAVVVGLLLWVIVRLDVQNSAGPNQPTTVSEKYTDVSIQVQGLDENRYTLESIEPQKVSLTVIGTASALRRVNINDYQVILDLTEARPGDHLMPLTATGFPSNVDVVLDPPNVLVAIDEKERKEMPVTINTIGTPADGFTAGEPVVQPNRVNVTVTSSLADEVASVVGLVEIGGATESVSQQVRVVALNADGEELDVEVSPAVVDVEVPITSPFKTMPLQISLVGDTAPGLAVGAFEQSASEVTVFAPQAYLNSLEFYDGLTIDLSTLTETRTFEFDVPVKPGIERVEPATVTATVTIVPAVSRTLEGVTLALNGRSENYEYRLTSPGASELAVTVEGSADAMQSLQPDGVGAVIDVSNLPPGVYELPIDYSLPSFVELGAGNTAIATVEIAPKSGEASASPEAEAGAEASEDGAGSSGAGDPGAAEAPEGAVEGEAPNGEDRASADGVGSPGAGDPGADAAAAGAVVSGAPGGTGATGGAGAPGDAGGGSDAEVAALPDRGPGRSAGGRPFGQVS